MNAGSTCGQEGKGELVPSQTKENNRTQMTEWNEKEFPGQKLTLVRILSYRSSHERDRPGQRGISVFDSAPPIALN